MTTNSSAKMTREEAIEKIIKLLEMNEERGASKAEAIQFALKAQQIIAEYDIQDYELANKEEITEESIEQIAAENTASKRWRESLAMTIAKNFRCKTYITTTYLGEITPKKVRQIIFMGYKHDAKAAQIVFDRLYEVGDILGREETRKYPVGSRAGIYDSFVFGYVDGVASELEKQTQALMLVCPREVEKEYNSMTFSSVRRKRYYYDADAHRSGYRAGKDAVKSGRLGTMNPAYQLAS